MQAKKQIKDEDYLPLPGRDGPDSFGAPNLAKGVHTEHAKGKKDSKMKPQKQSAKAESSTSEEVLIARALADLEKSKQG